ncbi:MAG: hypothetical protein K9M08_06815 [Pirellula sp.]|nr:hypothetical protein [Pirellula sp.]
MFDLLIGILNELKDIPGLSFLKSVHGQLLSKREQVGHSLEDARTMTENVTGLSSRIGKVVKQNKVEKRRKE